MGTPHRRSLTLPLAAALLLVTVRLGCSCDVWVDSGTGIDSESCGPLGMACRRIQQGVDKTPPGGTVCVSGVFQDCPRNGYLARISTNISLRGTGDVGATVDCNGVGAGVFFGQGIGRVSISGFHFWNASGSEAGGILAMGVRELSIGSSTFNNCNGTHAGGAAILGTGDGPAVVQLNDLQFYNCHGQEGALAGGAGGLLIGYSGPTTLSNKTHSLTNVSAIGCTGGNNASSGGGAGGIAISYFAQHYFDATEISNNRHRLIDVSATRCRGGISAYAGGGGGISISYFATFGHTINNSHSLMNVAATDCSGGDTVPWRGGAGGIAISHSSLRNRYNSHNLVNVSATGCSGGDEGGSGAGGISISYHDVSTRAFVAPTRRLLGESHAPLYPAANVGNSHRFVNVSTAHCVGGFITQAGAGGVSISYTTGLGNANNSHSLVGVSATNCSGGSVITRGGGAGGISISYVGGTSGNNNNSHSLSDVSTVGCVGGSSVDGGGAGGISISYVNQASGNIRNSHDMANVSATGCHGGGSATYGGGAGGISISYYNEHGSSNENSHELRGLWLQGCSGGDSGQGAGGLGVYMVSSTPLPNINNTICLRDSIFADNLGGRYQSSRSGIGAAGAVRIAVDNPGESAFLHVVNTQFSNNRINCSGAGCLAGALALNGVETVIKATEFDSNTSPGQGGALTSPGNELVQLVNTTFKNNSALVLGTGRLKRVRTQNTSFAFEGRGLALSASFEAESEYFMTCPPGLQVQRLIPGQFQCHPCPEGTYNRASGYLTQHSQTDCLECPSSDSAKVSCPGGERVRSQPGYFLFENAAGAIRAGVCPNEDACRGGILGADQCLEGYRGELCTECQADWAPLPTEPLMCTACPERSWPGLLVAVLIAAGVYGLLAYSSATRTTTTITATVQLSALLKMLLVHFTVLQAVEHVEWAWKLSIRQALHVPTTAAGPLTRLRLECTFGWDFHQRFAFYLASPVCGTALVVVGCYVACLCGFSLGSTRTTIGTMLVIGVYTFMPQAVSSLVTAFPCYVSEEGLRRMVYSPSSSCMEYAYVTATAVLGMFGLAAVAAWLIGYGLFKNRNIIQASMCTDGAQEITKDRTVLQQYGFLYRGYKSAFYLWELWPFSRKCLVLVIIVATPPTFKLDTRMMLLVLLISSSLALQVYAKPYVQSSPASLNLHAMDVLTQSCSLLSVAMGQYVSALDHDSRFEHAQSKRAATAVFVLCNVLLLLAFLSKGFKPLVVALKDYSKLCSQWIAEWRSADPELEVVGSTLKPLGTPLLSGFEEDERGRRDVLSCELLVLPHSRDGDEVSAPAIPATC